jgi:hypothetical protein
MEASGQLHTPAALTPGKELPGPIGKEAGWVSLPILTLRCREKSLGPISNRTPVVQFETRRYAKLIYSGCRNKDEQCKQRGCLQCRAGGCTEGYVQKGRVFFSVSPLVLNYRVAEGN